MNMNLNLPALRGYTPLGFLAALGLLRVLSEERGHDEAALSWDPDTESAVLHGPWQSVEDVAAELQAVVDGIPADGVLPGCPVEFPPARKGSGGDPALPPARDFQAVYGDWFTAEVSKWWEAYTVQPVGFDGDKTAPRTPFMAPIGRQSVRSFFAAPLAAVREHPGALVEALTGWHRYRGVTGEQLDHEAHASDTGVEGVPGATWLATMALPLFACVQPRRGDWTPSATLWCWTGRERLMTWPLWRPPLDRWAVKVLIEDSALGTLDEAPYGIDTRNAETYRSGKLAAMGVFALHAAERAKPTPLFRGGGVLYPASPPDWMIRRVFGDSSVSGARQ
ncbi:MAG: type I-G CRISPR-associated protein, Cas3-extension family [Micromonosporaceae bacterium]